MNSVVLNIWMAVVALVLSAILWKALDIFNNKDLLKICIFVVLGGFVSCILHLRTCLKDNSYLYKAMNKISGEMPH